MFSSKDIFLGKGGATGYQISRSVRLRSAASAYFNRTLTTPTNNKIWTWSAWIKRGTLSVTQRLFFATGTDNIFFETGDSLALYINAGSNGEYHTTQVFRDPSAWYHLVIAVDTTQATNTNRVKFYVNGTQITSFSGTITYPTQNSSTYINSAVSHALGAYGVPASQNYFDGYLTEINFIDGQALTPSSFGATSTTTGVWGPTAYTGTYGTNGFYLNFSDNSNNTAATIGKDYSGNGNNWTPNNISVTAGATYDSMVDTPTPYGTDTGVGGEVRGNYAVMNPLFKNSSLSVTNGNLSIPVQTISGTNYGAGGTVGVSSGKWYFEMQINASSAGSNDSSVGICKPTDAITNTAAGTGNMIGFMLSLANGVSVNYGTTTAVTGLTSLATNLIQVALDVDAGKVWFGADGVWANSGNPSTGANATYSSGIAGNTWVPALYYWGVGTSSRSINANFGQRAFAYTAPTGFKALCTQNLSTPTIANGAAYMAASLWTGNGTSQSINNAVNGISFQPDMAWVKDRSAARSHILIDAVRGTGLTLFPNETTAEQSNTDRITSFNSNGFSVGTGLGTNASTETYVGWNWKAGAGTTSSNTNGSITSTVSVNQTAGFSVVTYTGTGANATIGHGIGAAPSMVIIFERSPGGDDHIVYHSSLTSNQYAIRLNTTAAQTGAFGTYWNSTSPTPSVFSVGTSGESNQSTATYVAYCFAAIDGYSAFGKYTGNGSSEGPFVYTGFRPRWVLMKSSTLVTNWWIIDTARNTYNVANTLLTPSNNYADDSTYNVMDVTSNGFKIRTTYTGVNSSNDTYIYAAFAENSFKFSLAR